MTRLPNRTSIVVATLMLAIVGIALLLFLANQHRQARLDTRLPPTPVIERAPSPDSARNTPSEMLAHDVAGAQIREAPQSPPVDSPQELASFIRQFAASGGTAANLYQEIAAIRLAENGWWRKGDFGALLELAKDASVDASIRAVVMRVYLSGVSDAELRANADMIQNMALGETDDMVAAVLQGIAECSAPPETLIQHTLNAEGRSVAAKCHAWYAARLTQAGNSDYANLALAASGDGLTEASKVGFDYLAAGSFAEEVASSPHLRERVESLTTTVAGIPADADPIEVANGDAFVRALPHISGADDATKALFAMLEGAANPEMRLTALEQLVGIHLGGEKDLSQELHDIRNAIATLFQDPAVQLRAKARLNRVDQSATR